jgi:hypothetical protein
VSFIKPLSYRLLLLLLLLLLLYLYLYWQVR